MSKYKKGYFLIETMMYIFFSIFLISLFFGWVELLITMIRDIHVKSSLIISWARFHILFLQIMNNAPANHNDFLMCKPDKCSWKSHNKIISLKITDCSVIKTVITVSERTKHRVLLIDQIHNGKFDYFKIDNSIKNISFTCNIKGFDHLLTIGAQTKSV